MSDDTRARHPWAWGWADKFPDAATRAGLAQLAGGLLGGAPEPPPPPADTREPPPSRVRAPDALAGIVETAPATRIARTHGKGYPDLIRAYRGDHGAAPDAVARPRDEADVARVLDWCAGAGLAAVPFGGGTSVVGGIACPRDAAPGVVTIDLGALDRV